MRDFGNMQSTDMRLKRNLPVFGTLLRKQSTEYVSGIQQQITWMLSTETHPSNIIFLACPPAKCFPITEYNKNTEALCKQEGMKFAESLIQESHMDEDGYHITPENQHFVAKSVAAAALPCING